MAILMAEGKTPVNLSVPTLILILPEYVLEAPEKITVPVLPVSPIASEADPLTTPLIVRVVPEAVDTVPPRLPIARLTVAPGPEELATEFVSVPLFNVIFEVV
jgi:hypothetical protein